jgi:type IV secretion system protein VirD4
MAASKTQPHTVQQPSRAAAKAHATETRPAPTTRLPLGYRADEDGVPVGFTNTAPATPDRKIEAVDLEAGTIVVAPTGAGKSTSVSLPWALLHEGSFLALDPKGETAKATAAYRAARGNAVGVLDPFGQLDEMPAGARAVRLNPLDAVTGAHEDEAADVAREIAAILAPIDGKRTDRFWDEASQTVLSSFVLYVARYAPEENRNLGTIVDIVFSDVSAMAIVLAAMTRCGSAYGGAVSGGANLIASAPDRTRDSILTTLRVGIAWMAAPGMRRHLSNANLSLNAVRDGAVGNRPLSLYCILPIEKLESHAALLRLWSMVMLNAVLKRREPPGKPTLFLAEEAATLGALPALKTAFCQLRGFGLSPVLIYQDPAQLRAAWPEDHTLFRANADALMAFGARHKASALELADFVGWTGDIRHLAANEAVVSTRGGVRKLRRLSAVHDSWLADKVRGTERGSQKERR